MNTSLQETQVGTCCTRVLDAARLVDENRAFEGTGGVSRENRHAGFVPGFLDRLTGKIYRSCFADGRPAPIHMLDGLPGHLLDDSSGRLSAQREVVSGFLLHGAFYTRAEAAEAMRSALPA